MAALSLVLSLLFLSFLHLPTTLMAAFSNVGFGLELVHPNSPHFLCSGRIRADSDQCSIRSEIISSGLEYLLTLSIGTPPTDVLAVVDTTTSLIQARYNPNNSSTYHEAPCDSESCSYLHNKTCRNRKECQYHYPGRNGSYSDGILASETFTFSTSENQATAVSELSFGRSSKGIGRLGLGPGPLSLVSQMGSSIGWEFSYCLVPVKQNKSASVLYFGKRAPIGNNVASTPLSIDQTKSLYFVTLNNIRLGSVVVPFRPGNEVRIVIDTSTPFTYLPEEMYSNLREELADLLALSYDPAGVKWGPLEMCYISNRESGFVDAEITFGFDGANMTLRGKQAFLQVDDNVACFAMLPITPDDGVAVLGNLAQQDFYIGYDLVKKQLSFAPADCTKF